MEIINTKKEWGNILTTYFQDLRDIYYEYEYFDFYAKSFKTQLEGLLWEDENVKIFWTHLIRDIKTLEIFNKFNYFDLTTPYGSGGPLISVKTTHSDKLKKSLSLFFEEYKQYALKHNYVCEYISFHPFLDNWKPFKGLFDIQFINDIIVLDLTQDIEEICKKMDKKARYYTRKALEEFKNIFIVNNPSDEEIKDFLSIYYDTMDRNQAAEKYYFPFDFIKKHFKLNALLVCCKNDEDILASCAIFLKGTHIMHYHLSASNYYFKSSPSRAVLWKAIEQAKMSGLKWFHFGGGVEKNDSLFHFKKGFSKTFRDYYRGRIIFNKKIYQELCSLNRFSNENPDFYPLYRAGIQKNVI